MPPTIRIEMDHMRQQIVHGMLAQSKDFEKAVDEAIKKAIENFDFDGEVTRIVRSELTDMTRKALTSVLQNIMYSEEVRTKLHNRVDSCLNRELDRPRPRRKR